MDKRNGASREADSRINKRKGREKLWWNVEIIWNGDSNRTAYRDEGRSRVAQVFGVGGCMDGVSVRNWILIAVSELISGILIDL